MSTYDDFKAKLDKKYGIDRSGGTAPQTENEARFQQLRNQLNEKYLGGGGKTPPTTQVQYQPEATTSGGYYSRPELGQETEALYGNVVAAENLYKNRLTSLQGAESKLQRTVKDLSFWQEHLQMLEGRYNTNPTMSNADLYNRAYDRYTQTLEAYKDSYSAYTAAWKEYEPYQTHYNEALTAYRNYQNQQQQLYDNWRGTIRDEAAIRTELDALDGQITETEREIERRKKVASYDPRFGEGLNDAEARLEALKSNRALLQEEYDWSGHFRYADLMNEADFGEKSAYQSTANGKEPAYNSLSGMYSETGFNDLTYDYINRNEDARGKAIVNSVGDNTALLGLDKSYLEHMSDDEISIFNYLYATRGADAAYEFTAYLTKDLNWRQRAERDAEWRAYAEEDPVGSSVFSALISPLKGMSYLGQFADYTHDGEVDQNAAYNKFSHIPGAIRDEVATEIKESGKWGPVGSFGYQTGMSMADFLLSTAVTGGNKALTLTIIGSGAAADATIAAKDRGLSDDQSFALGTIAGVAEAAMEWIGLETLLNANLLRSGARQYILKNMAAEGFEEVGTDVINLLADILVSKDESQWRMSIDAYVNDGYSKNDAFVKAVIDQVITIGLDGVAGAISGGVLGGGAAVTYNIGTNRLGQQLAEVNLSAEDIQAFIETGLESDPDSDAYHIAKELQKKLDAGQELTSFDLSRIYQANIQAVAAEEVEREKRETAKPEGGRNENETAVDADVKQARVDTAEQNLNGGTENVAEEGLRPGAAFDEPAGDGQRGESLLHGSGQRPAGPGTGEQAGSVDSRTGPAAQGRGTAIDRQRTQSSRRNRFANLRVEKTDSLSVGISTGTMEKLLKVIPEDSWDEGMAAKAEQAYQETGLRVTFVAGVIQIRDAHGDIGEVSGAMTGEKIIVRADSGIWAAEQLVDHESYHAMARKYRTLNESVVAYIREHFTKGEFEAVVGRYALALRATIDVDGAVDEADFQRRLNEVYEEVLADAHAGMDWQGLGATRFTETVNRFLDENSLSRRPEQDNGVAEPTGPPTERFSYAGENAHNADLEALARAKEMQAAGVADETIRQQTGWHIGMDGKWRWEIDDSGMQYSSRGDLGLRERRPEYARYRELLDKANRHALELSDEALTPEETEELHKLKNIWDGTFRTAGRITEDALPTELLSDYVKHDSLFEAYPQLRKTRLRFADLPEGTRGQYDPERDIITLSKRLHGKPQGTLIHEIQHVIQKAEGFAMGSSPEFWEQVQKGEQPVRANDRRIAEAEKRIQELLDGLPPFVAGQFELHRHLEKSDPDKAMELADSLSEGPYGDEFSEFFLLTWDLDLAAGENNYVRGAGDLYRNTAGEIEARDAAARRQLTAEQRRNTAPARADDKTVFVDDVAIAELDAQYGPQLQAAAAEFSQDSIDDNIRQVAQMDPVAEISGQEFAKGEVDLITQVENFFNQQRNRAYNSELGEVILDRKGIKSDIAHGIGRKKAAAFAAVPGVIEQGLVVDYQKDWKGRGYDTAVVAAPINIGGQEHAAAVILVRSNQTNRFYVHEVLAMENGALPFKTRTREGYPGGDAPSILSILDRIRAVKDQTGTTERYSVNDEGVEPTEEKTTAAKENTEAEPVGKIEQRWQKEQAEHKERWLREQLGDEGYEAYLQQQKKEQEEKRAENIDKRERRKEAVMEKVRKTEEERLVAASKPTLAKNNLRRKVLDMFSIPSGQRAILGDLVSAYADRMIRKGSLDEEERNALFDRLYEAGVMTVPANEYFSEAKTYIKGGKIYVPDRVVADFGDDWSGIRKRAFAAGIYLTRSQESGGRSVSGIDVWNTDLAAEVPGLFDAEETDERTMLERIIQVAEEGKDQNMSLAEYTAVLAKQGYISENEFLDEMENRLDIILRAFASEAELEITLKKRHVRETAALSRENLRQRMRAAEERQARREAAQRQRARKELQELQQKTLKQLQWLSKNRNRAPEELRAAWDEVLADIDLYAVGAADETRWSDKYNASWKDIVQIYKDARENDPNFMPSKDLERIVDRLDARKIADMDVDALRELYEAAVNLRTEYYNRNNMLGDELHRLISEVYDGVKKEMQAPEGGYTGNILDRFFNDAQLSAMNYIQRMGGWNPEGDIYYAGKGLERGAVETRAYEVKANGMMADFLTEHQDWVKIADGRGKNAIWYELEVPQLLQLRMGDQPIFGPTVKVYMTPAQKVHLYLESKNYENLQHIVKGGRTFVDKKLYSEGKRQAAFARGTTIRLAPETVRKLVSDLTPEEMELAGILEQYYNTFAAKKINQKSNILYGYDKAKTSNYAPIYTNTNYVNSEFGKFDISVEGSGHMQERKDGTNPSYNISAFDAFERHVGQMSRFVGLAIPVRNWTKLWNWQDGGTSTKQLVSQKWGPDAVKYIEKLITDLQDGGEKTDTGLLETGFNKLLSNYISSVFGFNPSIVLKQLGSIPLASAYLEWENFPSLGQIRSIDRSLISRYTQDLEWRTMGYSTPETKHLKNNPNWSETNKFFRFTFGGGAITAMDGWAASVLWPWAENKVRREFPELEVGTAEQVSKGESPFYKKVAAEFEDAVARSQSTSDQLHQSTIRKSKNAMLRAFTIFRSDSAQTYNALRQKIGEAQYYARKAKGKGGDPKAAKAARKAVGAAVTAMLLNAVWAEAVNLLVAFWKKKEKDYRDEDGEVTAASVIGEMLEGVVGSIAGVSTFGEEIAEVIGNLIEGKVPYDIEVPGMEQANDLVITIVKRSVAIRDIIGGAITAEQEGGDAWKYLSDHGAELLGEVKGVAQTVAAYFTGLPVGNVEAFLIGPLKWIPGFDEAYADLFSDVNKNDLSGLEGVALTSRLGRVLDGYGLECSEDAIKALSELYEAGYTGAVPSGTPTSVRVDGEDLELNIYQQQTYNMVWSSIVAGAIEGVIASEYFTNADPETREKMLKKLYTYASEQARAELFEEYKMDSGAAKIDEMVAAGATVVECVAWDAITGGDNPDGTAKMNAAQKAAELITWDLPDAAKRAIFRHKISESRDEAITEFLGAGLTMDQFLEAYSKYSEINGRDLTPKEKATVFARWIDGWGCTSEQAKVAKTQLAFYNMMPASAERYDELTAAGLDADDAYDLDGIMSDLVPEEGEDRVADVQKWRACVDFSDDIDDQLAALSVVMRDEQIAKAEIANDFGVTPDLYVRYYEICDEYNTDGNGTYNPKEVKAAIDAMGGGLTAEQKAVLWQLANSSTKSAKNNPYSRTVGQRVLDARAAAKEKEEAEEDETFAQAVQRQLEGR